MGLFDEYREHPDKAVRKRANNWAAAIGLQKVDELCVSELLIQLARQHIEGKITMEEVSNRLNQYYNNKPYSSSYVTVPPDSEMSQKPKEESCG